MHPTEALPTSLELSSACLRLRPWQASDASSLSDAARESISTVGRWLPWCHPDCAMPEAAAWIAQCRTSWFAGEQFAFAAFDPATHELLGGVGFSQCHRAQRSANLGYWIRQSRQRQGAAAAAVRLAARFGFEQLGLVRIDIVVLPGNHASRRVAEKVGARFEGIARQRLWLGGRAVDAAVYGLIPADLS